MRIAIVAPSPVPFTIGGAEQLAWGLLEHLNDSGEHAAELIKLPLRENDLGALVASYRAFAALDLSHFDAVVSTKYPSWMVAHRRHVVWMLHPLRGLYDAYRHFRLPERVRAVHPDAQRVVELLRLPPRRESIAPIIDAVERLVESAPAEAAFPGPLARAVVHHLDRIGLSGAVRHAAISRTVAQRENYFPPGVKVAVAYPPTRVEARTGDYADFFTTSRLDAPKRLDLVIGGFRRSRAKSRLQIAGTGPDEDRLRLIAADDPRIEFLGYLAPDALADHYAGALAVPFAPLDEDYGLVTLEAMRAGKPVVTTHDSGGPTELVRDGVNGRVVEPTEDALAAAFDALDSDRELARRLGERARLDAAAIDWPTVTATLFGVDADSSSRPRSPARARKRSVPPRGRLVVATTFPVHPPRGGGQIRVYHFYRHLVPRYEIELVSLGAPGDDGERREIAPGFNETRIGKTVAHQDAEAKLSAALDWVPVTDVALPRLLDRTPRYRAALARAAAGASAVVACHPYAYDALADLALPLWYEAQDHEIALKRSLLPDRPIARELLADTERVERACCERARIVMTVTRDDADALLRDYGFAAERIRVVPNGVDLAGVDFTEAGDRGQVKRRLGLDGKLTCLFMGSWHGPNIEAARFVLGLARELPDVAFLLVGSVANAVAADPAPPNVKLLGEVSDEAKRVVLSAADVALNPMTSGSGSNLKMFDYMAAGAAVITTAFGARGLDGELIGLPTYPIAAFADAIRAAQREPEALAAFARRAREHVEREYDWRTIAARFLASLAESSR